MQLLTINQIPKPTLSKVANTIIKDQLGFRNNAISTNDHQLARDALRFEYQELQNEDVLDTQRAIHQTTQTIKMETIINAIPATYFGWWLTTKPGITTYYANDLEFDNATEIEAYQIPKTAILLSDLNTEGIFIATPHDREYYWQAANN